MMPTWESIDSWEELKKHLPARRLTVFSVICNCGSMTGRELNAHLQSQSAHKRLSELADTGLIEKGQPRRCRVTGRRSAVWGLADGIRTAPQVRKHDGWAETRCIWPIRIKRFEKPPTYKELQDEVDQLHLEVSRLRRQIEVGSAAPGQIEIGF